MQYCGGFLRVSIGLTSVGEYRPWSLRPLRLSCLLVMLTPVVFSCPIELLMSCRGLWVLGLLFNHRRCRLPAVYQGISVAEDAAALAETGNMRGEHWIQPSGSYSESMGDHVAITISLRGQPWVSLTQVVVNGQVSVGASEQPRHLCKGRL